MNVLSLFDGMSCGQIALNESGIKYDTYYASEIDKHAIKVTNHNFPETIQLGDVTKWREWDIDWKSIGLVFAGSPCQGFSFAGKQLAFDDPRSALFFTFVEIWRHVKKHNPNAKYLLENVKMKREHEIVISRYMGVNPIEINSALVSAQNRQRLYWTNIYNQPSGFFGDLECAIPQPEDKGILLRDILESEVNGKYYLSDKLIKGFINHTKNMAKKGNGFSWKPTYGNNKANCVTSRCYKMGLDDNYIVASRGRGKEWEQQLEPRTDGKTNTLTSVQKDNLVIQLNQSKESGGKQPYQQNRIYDVNGISPALCAHKSDLLVAGCDYRTDEGVRIRKNGKSGTLAARARNDESCGQMAIVNNSIRRLTPLECQRLQTVPGWYDMTVVSDTQRYKILGNGWTVDVIRHILSYL